MKKLLGLIIEVLGMFASFTAVLFGVWLIPQYLEFIKELSRYNIIRWVVPIGVLGIGIILMLSAFFLARWLYEKKEIKEN